MTRDVIITSISKNEALKRYAKQTTKGDDLWKDVISEMIISLYDMPEERFIAIYQSEGLISYCYKIIHLSWNSQTSPFYRKYRLLEPKIDNEEFEYDKEIDILYPKCIQAMKDLRAEVEPFRHPTEAKIFDLYLQLGSYRKTARELRLPTMTVFNIINGFKEQIKAKL